MELQRRPRRTSQHVPPRRRSIPRWACPAGSVFGLLVALCVAQSGSLFAADSWHDITFIAGEVRDPRRTLPRALAIGCGIVLLLYCLANVAYHGGAARCPKFRTRPSDRVATAACEKIFPGYGAIIMAVAIMISTFGCVNSLVLAGPRAYYAMAKDKLFFAPAGVLNKARVPGWSLLVQCTLGGIPGAAAHLRPSHAEVRQPIQQLTRLGHLRRA